MGMRAAHGAVVAVLLILGTGCGQKIAHVPAAAPHPPSVTPGVAVEPTPSPVTAALPTMSAPAKPAATPAPEAPADESADVAGRRAQPPQPPATPQPSPQPSPTPVPPEPSERAPAAEPDPEPHDPGRRLADRGFASVRVTQDGRPRPLVEGTRIEIAFERRDTGDVVRWRSGCNISGGDLTVTQRRLLVDPTGGTLMGCAEERHDQDGWVRAFFQSDPLWELRDGRLRLEADDTVVVFEPARYW